MTFEDEVGASAGEVHQFEIGWRDRDHFVDVVNEQGGRLAPSDDHHESPVRRWLRATEVEPTGEVDDGEGRAPNLHEAENARRSAGRGG